MKPEDSHAGEFDIAIIGYGPTGLALAYWLGKSGHRTVVIERWPALYTLPRAGHVDGEVMRLLQRMGIANIIAEHSSVTRKTVIRGADGAVIATVEAEESDQGWHSHYSLFQPELEQAIDAKVRDTGNVTVLQGWQADSIEQGDDGRLLIAIASGEGDAGRWIPTGRRAKVTARWLIGADGANSVVAQHMSAVYQDLGYRARALVVFAERLDPTAGAAMPDSEVGMLPSRPYVAFRESGRRFARWEIHLRDGESSAEMGTESKAWELIAPWGFTPENSRLVRHSVYDFCTLVAEEWRAGRILLAGDAAHRMPPFQGQGMCSGQRDAAALAWRLDLVLRGVSDDALMDSYDVERRPHVLALTENSAERGQQFTLTDPELARQRDKVMMKGAASANLTGKGYGSVPGLVDGFLMKIADQPVPPAGRLSAQFAVKHSGQVSLLDDHVGAGWILLAQDRALLESLTGEEREALDLIDARTWVVGDRADDDGYQDIDGNYSRWLSDLGCRIVLVRPDSYIFGGACDIDEVRALFASLNEQLQLKAAAV